MRVVRDGLGRVTKLFKRSATIPMPVSYPVVTYDDWLRLKPYYAFSEARVSAEEIACAISSRNNGSLVTAGMPGGFDTPRELMGEEAACLACFDQPELIDDMLDTCADTTLKVLERIFDRVQIDLLQVHEDMAGKSGPLFGPAQISRFIGPYYRRIWNECSRRGVRIFSQDSDGNMNPVLQAFTDAGINAFYPCEPAAGMDIVAIRKQYGEAFALKGGIDKHVLREDENAIIRELEYKLQPMMRKGTVFALDHRIPNGTPLKNYRFYVKAAKEILGIPTSAKPGRWKPMAF
jgi:uroporphyrinogen-III decarboxylase